MATARDGRLAEIEAENAALRHRLEQCTADLAEARAQQAAAGGVLQTISRSAFDLQPVLETVVESAARLCAADMAVICRIEDGLIRVAANFGYPAEYEAFARSRAWPPERGHVAGRAVLERRVVHIPDMLADPEHTLPEVIRMAQARTVLGVPLLHGDEPIGVIAMSRQRVEPFTERQIELVRTFAAQAVIAIENTRLLAETREALEQQTATAEVLQVINSSPGDLEPVFETVLAKSAQLCEADFGILQGFDGERFHFLAARDVAAPLVEFLRDPANASLPIGTLPGGVYTRLVRGEPVVHVPDLRDGDPYREGAPLARALVDLGGAGCVLVTAIRSAGVLIGALSIGRLAARPFSDRQIALLQSFAAQVEIAMENARLLTETREALERQTATAEVLEVINTSPGDVVPVFDAMLEKAMRLCDAAFGSFVRFDGQSFHNVTHRGVSTALAERLREPLAPTQGGSFARLVRGEPIVHIPDIKDDEAYRSGMRGRVAMADEGGARTAIWVALRKDDALLGAFVIYRQEVRPFTDKQIAVLQNFAAQAVIAIENARLLEELRARTHDLAESLDYQTATSDVLKVVARSGAELLPVLDTLVETAARICRAESGFIFRLQDGLCRMVAAFGIPEAYREFQVRNPIPPDRGTLAGRTVLERRAVHIDDAATDPEYARAEAIQIGRQRTMLGMPLLREDSLIGVLTLARTRVETFTEKQIELVRTFADQAVIAIENARLLGELRARTEEIASMNRDLEARVATQLGELERMGKLKRFLAPQLAEMLVAQGEERILESHRRDIVVVFCDLRGFTPFAETAEPEEVLDLVRDYHAALGPIVTRFEGTLNHFTGDGIMVLFNDPLPCPDAPERAVAMACEMRAAVVALQVRWRRQGRRIGFGVGIAQGYATLGEIGFAERVDYTAIGTVCNVAARLCAAAEDGQILLSARVATAVEERVRLDEVGDLALKGLSQEVAVFNVAAEQRSQAPVLR